LQKDLQGTEMVSVDLPNEATAIRVGADRGTDHPIEIFTPNYDFLFEQALERNHIPYFDGFCGSCEPFFDPATISNDALPPTWARLWKLHGSLGWDCNLRGEMVRGKGKNATRCIYPTHLKYDETQKLPYSALLERLKTFLRMPDSLLITSGFSFSDKHLKALIEESLAANRSVAVLAFQFNNIESETSAVRSGSTPSQHECLCIVDAAMINCKSDLKPGELPHPAWGSD
jgi:hypothetical protein